MSHRLDLVDGLGDIKSGRRRWGDPVLSILGLLLDDIPAVRANLFALVRVVLVLREFVRAFVEELRVDLHEHLHRVVNHAVDRSIMTDVLVRWCFLIQSEQGRTDSSDPWSSRREEQT